MEIIVTINVRSVVRSYIMQSAVYSNFSSAVQTFYAVITGIQNVSIESPQKFPIRAIALHVSHIANTGFHTFFLPLPSLLLPFAKICTSVQNRAFDQISIEFSRQNFKLDFAFDIFLFLQPVVSSSVGIYCIIYYIMFYFDIFVFHYFFSGTLISENVPHAVAHYCY